MNYVRAFLFVPTMSASDLLLIIVLNMLCGFWIAIALWTVYVWVLRTRVTAFFLPPAPEDNKPQD